MIKKLIISGGIVFLSVYCIKLQFNILQLRKQQRALISVNQDNYKRADSLDNMVKDFELTVDNYQTLLQDIQKHIAHDCPDFKMGPVHPPELRQPSMDSHNRELPDIDVSGSEPMPYQQYRMDGLTPHI